MAHTFTLMTNTMLLFVVHASPWKRAVSSARRRKSELIDSKLQERWGTMFTQDAHDPLVCGTKWVVDLGDNIYMCLLHNIVHVCNHNCKNQQVIKYDDEEHGKLKSNIVSQCPYKKMAAKCQSISILTAVNSQYVKKGKKLHFDLSHVCDDSCNSFCKYQLRNCNITGDVDVHICENTGHIHVCREETCSKMCVVKKATEFDVEFAKERDQRAATIGNAIEYFVKTRGYKYDPFHQCAIGKNGCSEFHVLGDELDLYGCRGGDGNKYIHICLERCKSAYNYPVCRIKIFAKTSDWRKLKQRPYVANSQCTKNCNLVCIDTKDDIHICNLHGKPHLCGKANCNQKVATAQGRLECRLTHMELGSVTTWVSDDKRFAKNRKISNNSELDSELLDHEGEYDEYSDQQSSQSSSREYISQPLSQRLQYNTMVNEDLLPSDTRNQQLMLEYDTQGTEYSDTTNKNNKRTRTSEVLHKPKKRLFNTSNADDNYALVTSDKEHTYSTELICIDGKDNLQLMRSEDNQLKTAKYDKRVSTINFMNATTIPEFEVGMHIVQTPEESEEQRTQTKDVEKKKRRRDITTLQIKKYVRSYLDKLLHSTTRAQMIERNQKAIYKAVAEKFRQKSKYCFKYGHELTIIDLAEDMFNTLKKVPVTRKVVRDMKQENIVADLVARTYTIYRTHFDKLKNNNRISESNFVFGTLYLLRKTHYIQGERVFLKMDYLRKYLPAAESCVHYGYDRPVRYMNIVLKAFKEMLNERDVPIHEVLVRVQHEVNQL